MPAPRRVHRPDFESIPFEYPAHLREAVADLPASPGVYIFHGVEGGGAKKGDKGEKDETGEIAHLPLYIGKSVNVRSRVLSHLRNLEEARLLRQTRRISFIPTAGEIGALLLEARLIKQQQPLHNQKLRRTQQLCSLRLVDGPPEVVYSRDVNFATEPDLFGLFTSRQAAIDALHQLADLHRLCYGALGLEKIKTGRACFRSTIRLCAGVCRGDEDTQAHADRLLGGLEAIRVVGWPYPGAIGVTERHEDHTQIHVIQNWCYLGSANDVTQAKALGAMSAVFDADGYKILRRPILSGTAEITLL